jgi:hypothetical protein
LRSAERNNSGSEKILVPNNMHNHHGGVGGMGPSQPMPASIIDFCFGDCQKATTRE